MQNQIIQLENAIRDIDRVKHQLHQNAAEVKSQIQTNISRHLEALRNREVWLLNQVELLQSAKEEILHVQQARLNKQLGVAQLGKCDDRICEKFDVSDLKPEENSYVTFRADSSSLRDNINSYGKVDVNGLPHNVFVQPGNPSTSLPRHIEEYDDAEHHILYKTVEEVSRAKSASSCIDVMVPRLSPRCEDWLAPSSSTTSVPSISTLNISLPALSDQTSDWLKVSNTTTPVNDKARETTGFHTSHSSVSSNTTNGLHNSHSMPTFNALMTSASTQSWLKQIKLDFEDEDDFEIVEKSSSLGSDTTDDLEMHDILVLPCSHSAPDMMELDDKTNPWLLTDSNKCMTNVDNKAYDVFEHYFATQALEKTKWLADSNCKDTKMSSCSDKCQMRGGIDIENLGVCQTDNKMWLKAKPEEPEVQWLCKANEPCSGFGECVSKPNCLSVYLQDKSSAELNMKNSICKGFDAYIGKPDSKEWLVNGGKNSEETKPVKCTMFDHIMPSTSSDWLKNEEHKTRKTGTTDSRISFDHIDKQNHGWLKQDTIGKTPKLSSSGDHNIPSWEYRGPTATGSWLLKKEDIEDPMRKLQVFNDLHIHSADNKWLSSKPAEKSLETMDEKSLFEKNQDNSKWLLQSKSN